MARFETSKGRSVSHCHVPDYPCNDREVNSDEIEEAREWLSENHPDAVELRVASWRYNCHGYAFSKAHAWFNYPDRFMEDDFTEVALDSAESKDVLLYMNGDEFTHSAIVTRVSGGEIVRVRSKWGVMPAVRHDPYDVPSGYGDPAALLRPVVIAFTMERLMDMDIDDAVQRAIELVSDPEINIQVLLASSPGAAKKIIESLPGVQELVALGPAGGQAALNLIQREETVEDYRLSAVALYVLERLPSPEVKQALAQPIVSRRFRGINSQLAAEAFLRSAGIEVSRDDAIPTALREAEKLQINDNVNREADLGKY